MPDKSNLNIKNKPGIKIEDVVRFVKNEAQVLGIADTVIEDIKVESGHDIRLSFCGHTEVLEVVRRVAINIAAHIKAFTKQDHEDIGLAVDEACTNVIQHSCACKSPCAMQLQFIMDTDKLSIRLTDNGPWGRGFDFEALPPLDMKHYMNTSTKGGLGVHLIKKVMDEVDYSVSKGADNCLTMVKHAKGQR